MQTQLTTDNIIQKNTKIHRHYNNTIENLENIQNNANTLHMLCQKRYTKTFLSNNNCNFENYTKNIMNAVQKPLKT